MTETNGGAGRPERAPASGSGADDPAAEIRVVIVDDHCIVLEGLSVLLDSMDGLAVIGEAISGEQRLPAQGRPAGGRRAHRPRRRAR